VDPLTAWEETVYAVLKGVPGAMTLGELAAVSGLGRVDALTVLRALDARGLIAYEVDARLGENLWTAHLDD